MKFSVEFYEVSFGRCSMKRRTNFDSYLEEQLRDPDFAVRFKKAGEAWDIALQLAALRKQAGLSQKELARRVGTSQQQISRLESPGYEGHSLSMLRRVAHVLGATVQVKIQGGRAVSIAEEKARYGN
jgi:DNA-binding XRE family transcriptional regulator